MTLPAAYEFLPLTAEHRRAAIELNTWTFPNAQDTSDLMNLEFYLRTAR